MNKLKQKLYWFLGLGLSLVVMILLLSIFVAISIIAIPILAIAVLIHFYSTDDCQSRKWPEGWGPRPQTRYGVYIK